MSVSPAVLRAVPLVLVLTVPTAADPLDIAQEAADAVGVLERATTGEQYPASAELAVPDMQPDEFERIVSGVRLPTRHRLLCLMGLVWSCRTWDEDGLESAAVMVDARRAVARLCAQRWPLTDPPAGLPVALHTVRLAAVSGRLARTAAPAAGVAPPFSLR